MKKLAAIALFAIGSSVFFSCDPIGEDGVPENLSIMLSDSPLALGEIVQVSDYAFSFDVQYRKDLIVSFRSEDGSITYEDQIVEGSRDAITTISLEAQSHTTLVTLSRANNNEEVFSFMVNGPFNKDETEDAIEDLSSQFIQDIVTMVQSEGVSAVQQLADLMSTGWAAEEMPKDVRQLSRGEVHKAWHNLNVKDGFRQKAADWKAVFDVSNHPKLAQFRGEEDTIEEGFKGLFEWNEATEEFDLTDEGWPHLELQFPAQGSTTNNSVLKVTELIMAREHEDGSVDYLKVEANLTVDATEVLTASSHVWESSSDMGFTAELYLAPFSMASSALVDLNTMKADFSESLKLNDEVLLGTNMAASLTTDEYGEYWPSDVALEQQVRGLMLEAEFDVALAEEWDGETNPDSFLTASMSINDQFLGDIVWEVVFVEEWGAEDWYPYLELPNGEMVDVIALLQEEIDEIETILVTQIENWYGG